MYKGSGASGALNIVREESEAGKKRGSDVEKMSKKRVRQMM